MSHASVHAGASAFAQRFRQALADAGITASPTLVAHEFNLRYWGRSISVHAARNWLLGTSVPRHDKLQVLAQWLRVSPEYLLLGTTTPPSLPALTQADALFLRTYLSLSQEHRRAMQSVVAAFEALEAAQT